MISETMPLNEWPSTTLKCLLEDLRLANYNWSNQSRITIKFIEIVERAIADAEEKEKQLPFS